mgnify:CR=1 FL=1
MQVGGEPDPKNAGKKVSSKPLMNPSLIEIPGSRRPLRQGELDSLFNKIKKVDFVVYTHDHADQTHGINELRTFFWINKKKIPIYADKKTSNYLLNSFKYLFVKQSRYYKPILKMNVIKNNFFLNKNKNSIQLETIKVRHGDINSNGYLFNKIAYISDCSSIPNESLKRLMNLKLLIIDCLKFKRHATHLNFKFLRI